MLGVAVESVIAKKQRTGLDLLSRERPSARFERRQAAADSSRAMKTSYAPQLILAEAKAATSRADDKRKGRTQQTWEITRPPRSGRGGGVRGFAPSSAAQRGTPLRGARSDRKGRATLVYPGDGVYEGEYVLERKEGKGKFYYVDGTVYEGQWKGDMKHGHGNERYTDGAVYDGYFARGARSGVGTRPGRWTYCVLRSPPRLQ